MFKYNMLHIMSVTHSIFRLRARRCGHEITDHPASSARTQAYPQYALGSSCARVVESQQPTLTLNLVGGTSVSCGGRTESPIKVATLTTAVDVNVVVAKRARWHQATDERPGQIMLPVPQPRPVRRNYSVFLRPAVITCCICQV